MGLFNLDNAEMEQLGGLFASMPTFSGKRNPMAGQAQYWMQAGQRKKAEDERLRQIERQKVQDARVSEQDARNKVMQGRQDMKHQAGQNYAQSFNPQSNLYSTPGILAGAGKGDVNQFRQEQGLMSGMKPKDVISTPSSEFPGKSAKSNSMRVVMDYAMKKKSGQPTNEREDLAFNLAKQELEREQRYTTPEGQMFTQPGLDLSTFSGQQSAPTAAKAQPTKLGGRKFTEGQTKSANFGNRMTKATKLMADVKKAGYEPGSVWEHTKAGVPVIGNFTASSEFQQYRQAQEDWVRAKLRKESGATIGDEEMEREITTYFPIPGDSSATKKQKLKARKTATDGMIAESQGAYKTLFDPLSGINTGLSGDNYKNNSRLKKYGLK